MIWAPIQLYRFKISHHSKVTKLWDSSSIQMAHKLLNSKPRQRKSHPHTHTHTHHQYKSTDTGGSVEILQSSVSPKNVRSSRTNNTSTSTMSPNWELLCSGSHMVDGVSWVSEQGYPLWIRQAGRSGDTLLASRTDTKQNPPIHHPSAHQIPNTWYALHCTLMGASLCGGWFLNTRGCNYSSSILTKKLLSRPVWFLTLM